MTENHSAMQPARWELRKINLHWKFPKSKTTAEFTVVAKILNGIAVHPTVTPDGDGKSVTELKESFSITAVACRERITWTRTEEDAYKIATYLATNFGTELSYRTPEKLMAAMPVWVAAWIKECRRAGGKKGGYVNPPTTKEQIEELIARHKRLEERASRS